MFFITLVSMFINPVSLHGDVEMVNSTDAAAEMRLRVMGDKVAHVEVDYLSGIYTEVRVRYPGGYKQYTW